MKRIVLVAGTRPEFVKLHPLAISLRGRGADVTLITTGQHRGISMRDQFIDRLNWPCQVERLEDVGAQDPLQFLASVLKQLPAHLRANDTVVAQGDTNSVLAATLVAKKLGLQSVHLEAGLRSYDLRMPEEHNRRICDHVADLLFAPTELDARHLIEEQCPGRTHTVGNTVMDAVRVNALRAPKNDSPGDVLVTVHRQENLADDEFVHALTSFLKNLTPTCLFPIHPRTRDALTRNGALPQIAANAAVRLSEPLDYLEFLSAMRAARVIVTDSGGVQEEATAPEIRRPVVILRRSTERTQAIDSGFSTLAPFDAEQIADLVRDLSWFRPPKDSPFGDGHAADRVAEILTG